MDSNPKSVSEAIADEEKKLFLEVPNAQTNNDKKSDVKGKKPIPDGGYGWVVLAASFLIGLILDAFMYSFGIILIEIKEYYNVNDKTANTLISIYTGLFLLCGPLVSGFVNQFGCRVAIIGGAAVTSLMLFISTFSPNIYIMWITVGFVGGISTGFFYISSLIIIPEWFDKKKGIATGITMAGSGIGFFVGPKLISMGLEKYDWKVVMTIVSVCILVNAFIGIFSKPLNPPNSQIFRKKKQKIVEKVNVDIMSGSTVSVTVSLKDSKKESGCWGDLVQEIRQNWQLLSKNWRFLFMALSNFFVFGGYFVVFVYAEAIGKQNNIPNPSNIISVIGIVNIPGRILAGYLADKRFVSPAMLNTISLFIGIFPLFLHHYYLQFYLWSSYLFSFLYALSTSAMVTVTTNYLMDIVGQEQFSNAMGIVSMFRGVGCSIGPFAAGAIADRYDKVISFYYSGCCFVVGCILSAVVSFSKQPKPKNDEELKPVSS